MNIRELSNEIADLVERKNKDYGNSFDKTLDEYGMMAYFLRIEDKLSRLKSLYKSNAAPQEARSVLPNSVKTELVMTMNLREWRHFFKLRVDVAAHPQMRELTKPLLKEMSELIPVIFDDLKEQ